MLNPKQTKWLTSNIERLLRANEWGDALAVPASFTFDQSAADLTQLRSRFFAYSLTKPSSNFDRTSDYLKEWAYVTETHPSIHGDTVRRALRNYSDDQFRELMNDCCRPLVERNWELISPLPATDDTGIPVPKRLVVQVDENQISFQGRGSKALRGLWDFRKVAKSAAGRNATPAKEGRYFGTIYGHEYIVMSGTMNPTGKTQCIAFRRRKPLRYNRAEVFNELLNELRSLRESDPDRPGMTRQIWAERILFDKGIQAYKVLEQCAMYARDSDGYSDFVTPCPKPSKKPLRAKPNTPFAMEGMREIANNGLARAQDVPGHPGLKWHQERRKIKNANHIDCNLVIMYYPSKEAEKSPPPPGVPWKFEKHWAWWGFYCYKDQTPESVLEAYESYSERWNCENFYQRLGYFMSILPSKNMQHRTMSFGYAMVASGVYAMRGILRAEEPTTDEVDWLRIKAFFDVASRQLQEGLDPTHD